MSHQVTITSTDTTGQLTGLRPGSTIVLKTRIVGAGTISITDHDTDPLDEHTAIAATQRRTVDVDGNVLNITGAGLDGTSAHKITYEELATK